MPKALIKHQTERMHKTLQLQTQKKVSGIAEHIVGSYLTMCRLFILAKHIIFLNDWGDIYRYVALFIQNISVVYI